MAHERYGQSFKPDEITANNPPLSGNGVSGEKQTMRRRLSLEMSELGKPTIMQSRATALFEAVRDGIVDVVNAKLGLKQNIEAIDKLDESGLALLHQAARYDRTDVARALLNHGARIDARSREDGLTALHVASRFNCLETAKLLLQKGSNPSLQSANGSTALHFAARLGNEEVAELLLNHAKVDVNCKDATYMTALHLACISGNVAISRKLLARGADIRAKTSDLMTPLHSAVYNGNTQVASLILNKAAEDASKGIEKLVGDVDIGNNTVLHLAAGTDDIQTAEVCLQHGADVNSRNSNDETALFVAAVKGNLKMVKLLVQEGADVNAKNADSKTVLHRAAVFNREEIISFLLDHGVPIDTRDTQSTTPFLDAVTTGQTASAKLLLQKGANIRASDIYMKHCIHLAVENEHLQTLSMLLQEPLALWNLYRPDVYERVPLHYAAMVTDVRIMDAILTKQVRFNFHDETQQTPLHLAAQYGNFVHVEALARRMASGLNERDEQGRTPLHNAAIGGHRKVCYSLVTLGADVHSRDNKRWTPLMCAAKRGLIKSCQELLNQQASPDDVNIDGDTALHIACRQGQVNVVGLLLDRGANMTVCNTQGHSCLEAAARAGASDVVMAILKHSRWPEMMEYKDVKEQTPMKLLIENFPECAELLMDRCVKRSEMTSPNDPQFTITYDFHLLDPGPDDPASLHGRRFFGPSVMVKHEQKTLLLHPLTQVLLKLKWSTFGRFIYYFNFFSYLIFVGLYSAFIIIERNKVNFTTTYEVEGLECYTEYWDDYDDNGSLIERAEEFCYTVSNLYEGQTVFSKGFSYIVFGFAVVHLLKEIIQILIQRWSYFFDISNYLEWGLYGTAVTFIIPYVLPDALVDSLFQATKDPYVLWLVGVASIFLCYMNLVLFLRRFRLFGIYITMFVEVLKTVIKVFLVFMVFVIGFAIVFFILFKEQDAFQDPGRAIIKVMVMTIGEFEFDDTFIETIGKNSTGTRRPLNPFPVAGFVFLCFFLLLMTIVLMNLLVGLAVGDIDAIQQNATLKRLAMQVEFVAEIEDRYPRFITRRLYRPTLVFRPNIPSPWKRLWTFFGIKKRSKLDLGLSFNGHDYRTTEYTEVRQQLDRTRKKVKTLVNVIEFQNTLLKRLVTKIDPGAEIDTRSLDDVRPTVGLDFLDGQRSPANDQDKLADQPHTTKC